MRVDRARGDARTYVRSRVGVTRARASGELDAPFAKEAPIDRWGTSENGARGGGWWGCVTRRVGCGAGVRTRDVCGVCMRYLLVIRYVP